MSKKLRSSRYNGMKEMSLVYALFTKEVGLWGTHTLVYITHNGIKPLKCLINTLYPICNKIQGSTTLIICKYCVYITIFILNTGEK